MSIARLLRPLRRVARSSRFGAFGFDQASAMLSNECLRGLDLYRLRLAHKRAHRLRFSDHVLSVKSPSKRQLKIMKNRVLTQDSLDEQVCFFDLIGLNDGSTIVDVGANIGYSSMMYSLALPSSDIIAIEPSKLNFEYLTYNCTEFPNIRPFNIGAHDKATEAVLSMPSVQQNERVSLTPGNTGLLSIYGDNGTNHEKAILHPLDDFTASQTIKEPIGFVKIDVEGNEHRVLTGASGLISKYYPVLEIEINPKTLQMSGDGYSDIKSLLAGFGYKPFLFDRRAIVPYESDIIDDVLDMVFISQ